MVTCSYPSFFILLKYSSTHVFNKNIIGNFWREYRETMGNLHIIYTRFWGIFYVVSLIFNVFLSHDVAKWSWKWMCTLVYYYSIFFNRQIIHLRLASHVSGGWLTWVPLPFTIATSVIISHGVTVWSALQRLEDINVDALIQWFFPHCFLLHCHRRCFSDRHLKHTLSSVAHFQRESVQFLKTRTGSDLSLLCLDRKSVV